jgi:hypothetical protein
MVIGYRFGQEIPGVVGVEVHCFWKEARQWGEERDDQKKFGPRSPLVSLGGVRRTAPPQLPTTTGMLVKNYLTI